MKKYQTQLFQNIFLAGIFLDVKYNVVLSSQEIEQANKQHLINIWNQLTKIQTLNNPRINIASTSYYENRCDSNVDEIEILMKEFEQKNERKERNLHHVLL